MPGSPYPHPPSPHAQTIDTIEQRLTEALAPAELHVEDDSARHAGHAGAAAGGGHFNLRVVSAAFSGLRPVQRHRLVYDRLADLMKRDVHALSMVLLAPDEVSAAPSSAQTAAIRGDSDHS